MTDERDRVLIAEASEGVERAFNELVDRHQSSIRTFLRNLMANDADADDVAQETFLAAWQGAGSFAVESSVRTWLFAIAWRRAKMAQRGWARQRRRDVAYAEFRDMQPANSEFAGDRIAIDQALASLPVDQRAAVVLCLGCGFSHSEAGLALDAPVGTVKSHIARARARLRDALGE